MEKGGLVYILASKGKCLYTGVTSELAIRVKQHKNKAHSESFTARYNIERLVFYRGFETIQEAIAFESRVKNMHRVDKIQLIVTLNPDWADLSAQWGKPAAPFDEAKLRPPIRRFSCPPRKRRVISSPHHQQGRFHQQGLIIMRPHHQHAASFWQS